MPARAGIRAAGEWMSDLTPVGGARGRRNRYSRPAGLVQAEAAGGAVAPAVLDGIRRFQSASTAPSTRRGYETHWLAFTTWCQRHGFQSLPAEPLTVAAYLSQSANLVDERGEQYYAVGTLVRWLTVINKAHAMAGYPKPGAHPDVELTIAGIRRERSRPIAKKAPLLLRDINRVLGEIDLTSWPHGVIGHRDWAMLLIGFGGAYRRSELASLRVGDVRIHPEDGLHVVLRRSKTDQDGIGMVKGIPFGANPATCAPCAFVRWLRVIDAARGPRSSLMRQLLSADTSRHICREKLPPVWDDEADEALFRPVMKNGAIKPRHITGDVVNSVVQRRAAAAGLNSITFGGHSLRAGFVTQAFRAGATHHEIMRQTGHKDVTTLEGYSREHDPLAHNAVTRVGM